jgi:hypothetical protein
MTDFRVIARSEATKQSRLSLHKHSLDCFAEPVIGPRLARTRWLATTEEQTLNSNHTQEI